jgi:hypothetical protein
LETLKKPGADATATNTGGLVSPEYVAVTEYDPTIDQAGLVPVVAVFWKVQAEGVTAVSKPFTLRLTVSGGLESA